MSIYQSQLEQRLLTLEKLRACGDARAERAVLWNISELMMAIATTQTHSPLEGRKLLLNFGALTFIERFCNINLQFGTSSLLLQPEIVHLAWFLDSENCSKELIAQISNPQNSIFLPATNFWRAYCSVMVAFANRTPIDTPEISPKGVELFWYPYMNLMSAISKEDAINEAVNLVATAFNRRQEDSRWQSFAFEGRPKFEAHWDLRMESICCARKSLQATSENSGGEDAKA